MTQTSINDALLGTDSSGVANILDNAGFEIWQRGTSFSSPTTLAYTTDRWFVLHDGSPTFTVSQESSIVDSGSFACKVNITALGGATAIQLRQLVENFLAYAGKTLTLSVRVWSNVAGTQIRMDDGINNFYSNTHTGNSTYQTLTCTGTMSASISKLQLTLNNGTFTPVSVSTLYFDSATLIVGSQPATFSPLNPQIDLARCQRFYYASRNNATGPLISNATGDYIQNLFLFPVTMRVAPIMTTAGVGGALFQNPTIGTATIAAGTLALNYNIISTTYALWEASITHQTTYNILNFDSTFTASADL